MTVQPDIAGGDHVAVQWTETGVYTGSFCNLTPPHKPFEAHGLNLFRHRDGLIVKSWINIDPRTIRARPGACHVVMRVTADLELTSSFRGFGSRASDLPLTC